ncbi:MAG: hypothetical protein IK093_16275 [Ruminiclostridium sp.]|nr:hypothetical protein [Ruminiclostridium sp.]
MTEIIIIGDSNDTALERLIKHKLSETYSILYIKGNEITGTGIGYELTVIDSAAPIIAGLTEPIVVAKKNAVLPEDLPPDCTAVISSHDPSQLRAASRSGVYVVDCGLSPTSTVSFSSESDDTLVISLNRSLKALSGREIQPLEMPVKKLGTDDYTLMSFTALRLLLDDFDSELGKLI